MNDIPAWKEEEVNRLTKLLRYSPVIGVVDIEGIPSAQMQQMRAKLRGDVNLTVSRNTLIKKALEEVSEDREDLETLFEHIEGQIALVTTSENPFKLYKKMESTKTKAPASGGEIAPEDVEVQEGDTPFKPGPIVGDLQNVGIPASIQSGKVVINTDKVVVEEGEVIPKDLATMLSRLDIHPVIVGLDLQVVFEEGTIFDKDSLQIDTEEYAQKFKNASLFGFNLSVNSGYPIKDNIETLITQAHSDSLGLALESDLITDGTMDIQLSKAHETVLTLASKLDPDALDDELKDKFGIKEEEEPEKGSDETEEESDEEEENGDSDEEADDVETDDEDDQETDEDDDDEED